MAKSRKRKRLAVDTQLAVDVLSEEVRTGQLRANPQDLKDDTLFVEDTQPDAGQIHLPINVAKRTRSSKKKRMTRAQEIITANQPLPFAPGSTRPRTRKRATNQLARRVELVDAKNEVSAVREDIWSAVDTSLDWLDENAATATRPTCTDVNDRPHIPAVEVDPAGCSYNPDQELHQDTIAKAVAAEYLKQIDKELQPKAPQLTVTAEQFALKEMEIGLYDDDTESEDGGDKSASVALASKRVPHRKTSRERVRQQRHRQLEKQHILKQQLKRSRRDLENLYHLSESVQKQEEEQAARRARRKADVEDRQAQQPPKLGRLRFTPVPTQVLLTEDVTGSLRKLKTVPVIAQDRFKSMQKRGLIHVTVKQHWVKPSKRRVKRFEKKATQELHQRSQAEIQRLKKQRKNMQPGSV